MSLKIINILLIRGINSEDRKFGFRPILSALHFVVRVGVGLRAKLEGVKLFQMDTSFQILFLAI